MSRTPRKNSKPIGVLFSGGLDSVALAGVLAEKGHTIWPVYVQCGLTWEENELYWAKRFLKSAKSSKIRPLKILNLSLEDAYKNNWSKTGKFPSFNAPDHTVFLPARNLLLLTKALLYLSSRNVTTLALATLKGNPFEDGRRSYFNLLNRVFTKSFKRSISIETPFRHQSKKQIISRSRNFPIHLSLSCVNPRKKNHCGKCNKCAERQKAFQAAGIPDKTYYLN